MKIFISIGSDCTIAASLKTLNLRTESYPYDWIMSLDNLNQDFESNFDDFYKDSSANLKFTFHGQPPQRRIDRLKNLLENYEGKLYLVRKAHQIVNHTQIPSLSDEEEIHNIKRLNDYLKNKYKNLNFEIILFLVCEKCSGVSEVYDRTRIISLTGMETKDDTPWADCIRESLTNISLE